MKINYKDIYAREHQARFNFHQGLNGISEVREGGALAFDGSMVMRNGLAVTMTTAAKSAVVAAAMNTSVVAGAVLGAPLACHMVYDSWQRGKQALKWGDREGVANSAVLGTVGSAFLTAMGLTAYQGIEALQGAAISTGAAVAGAGLGVAMYGMISLYAAYNLKQAFDFGHELAERKKISTGSVLQWLYSQVCLRPEEMRDLSDEEISKKLQQKWSAFEHRTNPEVAKKVRENIEKLLPFFIRDDETDHPEASQFAQELIEDVEKANFKTKVKFALFLLIGLIGVAAMVSAMIFSGGLVVPLILLIVSSMWFTIDSSELHNLIGEKSWTWHRGEKPLAPVCQRLSA